MWWPVRVGGLAIALLLASCAAGSVEGAGATLVVQDGDGEVLVRAALPADADFAMRYRNSLYGSLVEERFTVVGTTIELRQLAADEIAVLEEYYAIDEPAIRARDPDPRAWLANPALDVRQDSLTVAATDLGERALLVDGLEAIELWRLASEDDPMLTLEVER